MTNFMLMMQREERERRAEPSQLLDPLPRSAAVNDNNPKKTVDNPALPDGPIPDSGVPGPVSKRTMSAYYAVLSSRAIGGRLTDRERDEEERLP